MGKAIEGFRNISCSIAEPIADALDTMVRENKSFLKTHLVARFGYLGLASWSFITRILDTAYGVILSPGAIITGGAYTPLFKRTMAHLDSACKMFPRSYFFLLKTLNPHAEFIEEKPGAETPRIPLKGDGFIAQFVQEKLKEVADRLSEKDRSFFNRHVTSRLTYLLLLSAMPVVRLADTLIGLIAALASFAMLGKCASCNHLAFRALRPTALIKDTIYYTVKVINPWAGKKKERKDF